MTDGKKYILQSLNRAIFRAPEAVMENISRIEAAFVECGSDVAVPHFIASGDKIYAVADEKVWRIYEYITATADAAAEPAAAGRAFGTFIRTMEGSKLSTVPAIEGFHDYDGYFAVLVSKSGIDRSVMVTLDRLRDTLGQVFDSSMKKRIIHGDACNEHRLQCIVASCCRKRYHQTLHPNCRRKPILAVLLFR